MNNQIISNYYSEGNSLKHTANKFNISIYKVKQALRETETRVRTRQEQTVLINMSRSKSVDQNFFDVINSKSAYYLGFLAADGTVSSSRNSIKIGLSSVDREWLEKYRRDLVIEREVLDYQTQQGFNVSEVCFSSAKIKQELAKYDIVPRKTYEEISMKNIPDEFKVDYIRGFFDGDGSFSWNKNTKQGMVKITSHKENILKEIQKLFPKGKIYYFEKRDIYSFELSTIPSINFLETIYKEADVYLKRKKDNFSEFIQFRI
ncbi:LAGLIDADG family homing endonuclease [Clostridium sp.]|uniref:LAGLIDADG family homing endonuclease n=1 Tax=Clostridium sp. TaxID=1506 RepID=UPI002FC74947